MQKIDPQRVVYGERAVKYQTHNFLVFTFKWGKVFHCVTPLKQSDLKKALGFGLSCAGFRLLYAQDLFGDASILERSWRTVLAKDTPSLPREPRTNRKQFIFCSLYSVPTGLLVQYFRKLQNGKPLEDSLQLF